MATTVNILEYLQSKTQVDFDGLDVEFATNLGPFIDCTSNQADCYYEFIKPRRAALLKKSVALAKEILPEFPNMSFEELAVEICMVSVTLTMAPLVAGDIHVMVNPSLAYSTLKVMENCERIDNLCRRWDPSFDPSRLCIKVPATWEGLQACRKLKGIGIKTLATTLFTMEQAILAGEVGCVSISPFVHELRVHFDETYHDVDPIFDLCVKAQQYYELHAYTTKVKACSLISAEEVMKVAGINALTLPPTLLNTLAGTEEVQQKLESISLFQRKTKFEQHEVQLQNFMNEEEKFRDAFAKREGGKGQRKTTQAKAEALMRDIEQGKLE